MFSAGNGRNWADEEPHCDEQSAREYGGGHQQHQGDDSTGGHYDSYSHGGQHSGGYEGGHGYGQRESHPLPDRAPFTAFLGNVPYDLNPSDVESCFGGCGKILDVRVTKHRDSDRAKGCFVEFETKEMLAAALEKDGSIISGRPVRVDVAAERRGGGRGSFGGGRGGFDRSQNRGGSYSSSYNSRSWNDRESSYQEKSSSRQPREYYSYYQQQQHHQAGQGREKEEYDPPSPTEAELADRPKLQLKPRSIPLDKASSQAAATSSDKPNPFGSARPVDNAKKLAEIEAKISQEREAKKASRLERERKEAAESEPEGESAANEDENTAEDSSASTQSQQVRHRRSTQVSGGKAFVNKDPARSLKATYVPRGASGKGGKSGKGGDGNNRENRKGKSSRAKTVKVEEKHFEQTKTMNAFSLLEVDDE
mmetsp:Transcript_12000/g.30607  ORF Transcript_12000/g.30607 Transcript_12000/m.30607 type:complete len:423 (-) Transcript_12000:230-1498(-)